MEHIKRKNDLSKPQLGIVVDNQDPKKLNRVKVKIKGMLEEKDTDKLPWVTCRVSTNSPGGKGASVNPPRKNAKLVIVFDYGDINFPAYTGYWLDKTNCLAHDDLTGYPDIFKNNYPDVNGWADEVGNYEIHDLKDEFTEYGYSSGYKRRIDKQGNLTDKALKSYLMEVAEEILLRSPDIKLGTGTSGHKKLVTEDHLPKYDGFITSVDTWITGVTPILAAAAALAGILTLPATSSAWIASVPTNKENNQNRTSQTKAK